MAEIWEVGKILSVTEEFLAKRGIDSARIDAELILADTLDISRESLLARREHRLTDIEVSRFRERIRSRAGHQPVAYLLRRKEFYSLPFFVNEHVLIPRPETEHLVESVLSWMDLKSKKAKSDSAFHLCEIGAGSGCIAAALAKSRAGIFITATEKNEEAARVAVKNISDLGLIHRVRVAHCDLFPIGLPAAFDAIVSNPPYLSLEEYEALPPTIRKFEPRESLTDEKDGLGVYRRILSRAGKRLQPEGSIFFEISPSIAPRLADRRFWAGTAFSLTSIQNDLAGRPRVAEFRYR